ncbi:hypothetical protein MERGE_003098 [Pneumocystis wakefieldiae]|uniref:AB hydrolase-1 domain-containing protein n=1 Tax=Pneumocystis wakefieldiae TaxID=38082 RepID=A0A899FVZ3_9ASCO|nr:hypothetical protein MERGE_003098 [Pneumocystis wakefieldiae]
MIMASIHLSFTRYLQNIISKETPILVLHGLFGSKRHWNIFCRSLNIRTRRSLIALDLRNHGESPHGSPHNYEAMANDVVEFIGSQRLGSVVLLGHSMGAKTCMAVALTYPTLVESMILLDNAPVHTSVDPTLVNYIEQMQVVQRACVKNKKDADRLLQASVEDANVRHFLLSNLVQYGDHWQFKIPLNILGQSLQHIAGFPFEGTYSGRTLFIRGSKSRYVLDSYLSTIRKFFPNSQVVTLDAGHWVHVDQREETLRSIEAFLQYTLNSDDTLLNNGGLDN